MVGATLQTAATYFMHDSFLSWDAATDTFPTSFTARLERIDRFKTIYNRPTRREHLSFQSDVILPASGVIKRQDTDEIFLVSDTVQSEVWQGNILYEKLATLHRVTPDSGGPAAYHAVTTSGSGADLGPVSLATAVPAYLDIELRSMAADRDAVEVMVPEMLAFFSKNVTPEAGDYFLFDGDYYRIEEYYADSGYHSARLVKEDPAYTTLTFKQSTGTSVYDPATGTVSATTTSRQVSAIITSEKTARDRDLVKFQKVLGFYIYKRHIGFTPKVGERFTHDSTEYEVTLVEEGKNADQWHLEASI